MRAIIIAAALEREEGMMWKAIGTVVGIFCAGIGIMMLHDCIHDANLAQDWPFIVAEFLLGGLAVIRGWT